MTRSEGISDGVLPGALGSVVGIGGAGWAWADRARARWAPAGGLRRRRRRARRAQGARLTLGSSGGRRVYAEQRHAIVAFGPPQSGTSAGLAVPALLEWTGPAVASSIKTDLL